MPREGRTIDVQDAKDLYIGLSGLDLNPEPIDLGNGVTLKPTFAHVFSTDILAFERPATPSSYHPGPWQANSKRAGTDITAELHIPASCARSHQSPWQIAKTIVTLLRIFCDPLISSQIASDCPIDELKERKYSSSSDKHVALLIGSRERHFHFQLVSREQILQSLNWVAKNWEKAVELNSSSPEFEFALQSFDEAQFIPSHSMMLVSLWGALEAIFSRNNAELRFRVSANIAAFLAPRGAARIQKQREVLKLYDARSSAAHGSQKHGPDELLRTFELLRHSIIRMIELGWVPSKEKLEEILFS